MNTEITGIEPEQPESAGEENSIVKSGPAGKRPGRSAGVLAFFAFLCAIAALAGTGWMWWQSQASLGQEQDRVFGEIARLESSDTELSLKLSQMRDEMSALATNGAASELEVLKQQLDADRSKSDRVEKALEEQMTLARSLQGAAESLQGRLLAAEAALSEMSTRELDAGGELDVAEVDYLLRLANERLQLFSDPEAADRALEVADLHLEALNNPMYTGVRQEIAAARRELASVRIPDYLDMTGRLDAIQQQVASLPFLNGEMASAASAGAEEAGWWEKVKGVFSNLVTVRRSTVEENERISLQDKDYIRQGIWLQLEVARLALMRRDQEAFRASLGQAGRALSAWFDPDDDHYKEAMQGINELSAAQVQVVVPDITAPWSSLRLLRGPRSLPANAPRPGVQDSQADPEGPVAEPGEG